MVIEETATDSAKDLRRISCLSEADEMSNSAAYSDTAWHGLNGRIFPIFNQINEVKDSDHMNSVYHNEIHTDMISKTMSAEESFPKTMDMETKVLSGKGLCTTPVAIYEAKLHSKRDKEVLEDSDDHGKKQYYFDGQNIETGVLRHATDKDSAESKKKVIRTETDDAIKSNQCPNSHTNGSSSTSRCPVNWFPRRRTESYLERKIRMLQEVEGRNATLDETLGGSNPHLSRIEREKLAVQAAAGAAMEARKAALVEASWCRILKAARIPCELAEAQLQNAEKKAAEAVDAAAALGVVMHNKPGGPKQSLEVETSTANGGQTHNVSASFQTAFEVDKEVAGAVKVAIFRLGHLPACAIKGTFDSNDDAIRRLSIKPDEKDIALANDSAIFEGLSWEASSESEAQAEGEQQTDFEPKKGADASFLHANNVPAGKHIAKGSFHKQRNSSNCLRSKQVPDKEIGISEELVDLMLARVKLLKEEELVSLAMIVATCGLTAMLKEETKQQEFNSQCSSGGLGDILVKHISRLEAEKAAASKAVIEPRVHKKKLSTENIPDLGSILVKHVSKLEREVQEARNLAKSMQSERENLIVEGENTAKLSQPKSGLSMKPSMETSMDLFVNANNDHNKENRDVNFDVLNPESSSNLDKLQKSNFTSTSFVSNPDTVVVKHVTKLDEDIHADNNASDFFWEVQTKQQYYGENHEESLDKVLVKHTSRLEKEKLAALASERESSQRVQRNQYQCDSLDKVVVKHVSKMEKAKMAVAQEETSLSVQRTPQQQHELTAEDSLDKVLVKHISKLEKEKMAAAQDTVHGVQRNPQQHDMKMEDGLDKVLIKHISKLERDKMEAKQEEFQRVPRKQNHHDENSWGSLDHVLVKHISKLEKEKMAAAKEASHSVQRNLQQQDVKMEDCLDKVLIKRISKLERAKLEAGQESFQNVQRKQNHNDENSWGSLEHVLVKHISKLEKEKMAAAQEACHSVQRIPKQHDLKIEDGLDKVLVKHISKLEKEKMAAAQEAYHSVQRHLQQHDVKIQDGLDKVLVKHTSKLEREKMEAEQEAFQRVQRKQHHHDENSWGSLDQVLVKHLSKLEKEKLSESAKGKSQEYEEPSSTVTFVQDAAGNNSVLRRHKNARVQEIQETWGGLSLGSSLRPHLTKLELEKAAWLQAEEEAKTRISKLE